MPETTVAPLEFTPVELDLICDLLRRELEELPAEIHHTDSSEYRAALRERRAVASNLFRRLQEKKTAASA